MQMLTALTATEAYPAVPGYDLALTAISLLISTILPLFVIIYLQIRYKAGGATILIGVIQYGISLFMMLGGLVVVMLGFINISDATAIKSASDISSPILTGFFLPLAIYLVQYIFGNKKVKKTEDLDQRYLGKTSVLALWGGFTIFGDYSVDYNGSKKWPIFLTLATTFAFLKNAFSFFFIEISSLYAGLSGGKTGAGGSYMSEADYKAFYDNITSAPLQPALQFIFSFSIVLLLTILVFKLGGVHRFWPILVLMPVTAGLELASELISKSPLIYFFFVMFIAAMMLYVVPRLSRLAIPSKKPKLDLDPE